MTRIRIRRRKPGTAGFALPGTPELLSKIFANRGVSSPDEINHKLSELLPVRTLSGVVEAAELLYTGIKNNDKIIIVADFDADGATSCAMMVDFLRRTGAKVDYKVPDRVKHGYGLSPAVCAAVIEESAPGIIMTVDNGISSLSGVALAKKNGVKVLISDHHLPPEKLPAADVIVNPNMSGNKFASKNLAGVGVAFYLVCALYQKLKAEGKTPDAKPVDYLDLAALGTVADVVSLDKNNRIIVKNGIERMRAGLTRPGIQALFKVAGREIRHVSAADLGFAIAPRINAAGRMLDMTIGIECLLARSELKADKYARMLDEINQARKTVETEMQTKADNILQNIPEKNLPAAICLYDESWHEGVVGIVAGKIKDNFNRPTIVFARSEEGLKGSARSVGSLNIRDCLANIERKNPGVIQKFGGHAVAAGLTIGKDMFARFAAAFNHEAKTMLSGEDLSNEILTDAELEESSFTLSLANQLKTAAPWGCGFPEPLFDGKFKVEGRKIVGEKHLKLVLKPLKSNLNLDAIWFNYDKDEAPEKDDDISAAYLLDVNYWRGNASLQLKLVYVAVIAG